MTNKTKNILSAVVAWTFAAWVFIATANLKSGTSGMIRPEFIPRVVAVLLIFLGIGMFVQGLRMTVTEEEKERLAKQKREAAARPIIERLTPILTLVLIFLFLLGLNTFGITISTTVYLTLQMTLLSGDFRRKSWLKYFIISIVAAVAILLIFCYGFKLKLPVTALGF